MASPDATPQKARSLTGDRPTGPLHLGHLLGSLQRRVALQNAGTHECFLIVADLHTLTTRPQREHIADLPTHVRAVVLDMLSAGIDPERSTIYLQSGVPAVYDLAILLQMLIPASTLRPLATLEQMAAVAGVDDMSFGLLGYPVLQAADILMARAELIPVGGDNLAHVEIARDVAQRFNAMYGDVFPLPKAATSRVPTLPGIGPDGPNADKMSKSAGNGINLGDPPDVVADKLRTLTSERLHAFVRALIEDAGESAQLVTEHAAGRLSDGGVHDRLIAATEALLAPIRERRASFDADRGLVEEILVDGTIRAREVAYATLQQARASMGLEDLWKGLITVAEHRANERKKPY